MSTKTSIVAPTRTIKGVSDIVQYAGSKVSVKTFKNSRYSSSDDSYMVDIMSEYCDSNLGHSRRIH